MKQGLLWLVMLFLSVALFSQQAKTNFQTHNAKLKLIAFQQGKKYEWDNDNITVNLNYKTGELLVLLKNSDFYDPNHPEFFVGDTTDANIEYELRGHLPVEDILKQQNSQQTYPVELQLVNEARMYYKNILFNMTVTLPDATGNGNYRIFLLEGKFSNHDLDLPAFRAFDDEVYIILGFSGAVLGN